MIHALKCQKFDYLKIRKNVQIEYKKKEFSMNHFGQNYHFFIGCYFIEIFGWN